MSGCRCRREEVQRRGCTSEAASNTLSRGGFPASLLGCCWLAGRGESVTGAQWDRANGCVAALPGVDWHRLAAMAAMRQGQLPASGRSPVAAAAAAPDLEASCLQAVGPVLFIAPQTGLAGPPAAPHQQAPCCPCAGGQLSQPPLSLPSRPANSS